MTRLFVVGIGPGGKAGMTVEAQDTLGSVDAIVGYSTYVRLVEPLYPGKRFFDTPMTHEVDRCRKALDLAQAGESVAMVCSGDAVVYGMAALLYELGVDYPDVEIKVVAGVTAALSGGARLGAPLTHDFAVISLSDLLTPWELIEKRLECVGMADLACALYNPSSKKRADYLRKACAVLMRHRSPQTVCGIARNIGREGEEVRVMSLGDLSDTSVDMFTTVFIGNSQTRAIDGHMVTPRGYRL